MNFKFNSAFVFRVTNGYRVQVIHDKEYRDGNRDDDVTNEYIATSWAKVMKIMKENCQDYVKEEVNAD